MTIIGLMKLAAVLTAVFSLVTLLGIKHHLIELFTHFRLQYLIASVLLFAIFAWLREMPYAGAMFVSAAFSIWYIAPWYLADKPAGGEIPLKMIHANVLSSNTQHQRLIEFVAEKEPDIVFLQEVSPEWSKALGALSESLPHSYVEARPGNFGIAVYSKWPFDSVAHVDSPPFDFPTIVAKLSINDEAVTFVSTHPMIPLGASMYSSRNEQLASVAKLVVSQQGRMVFSGDLNASIWDPKIGEFQDATGLVNVRAGSGILATWPTFFLLAGIPIDHAMVSSGIGVVEVRTGKSIGSDHLPLVVTLSL